MKFVLVQDIVWTDFLVSGLIINYMVSGRIKFKNSPLRYIGDLILVHAQEIIFPESEKM